MKANKGKVPNCTRQETKGAADVYIYIYKMSLGVGALAAVRILMFGGAHCASVRLRQFEKPCAVTSMMQGASRNLSAQVGYTLNSKP